VRVLFDTNVWIAAFLTHGTCHELLEQCVGSHHLLVSEEILQEVQKVLSNKFNFPKDRVEKILFFIERNTEKVEVSSLEDSPCRDPNDNHLLACAVSGGADGLITGDDDLLVMKKYQGVPILKPGQFWQFERESKN